MMRRIILKMHMSVDGFVSGPGGDSSWIRATQDQGLRNWLAQTLRAAGTHAAGSVTFAEMAEGWAASKTAVAEAMNSVPKVVFSKRASEASELLTRSGVNLVASPSWADAKVLSGDLSAEIQRLKHQSGNDVIVHGGARLATSLIQRGLIDEYRLVVHPAALGAGTPLFADVGRRINFRVLQRIPFASGACVHVMQES